MKALFAFLALSLFAFQALAQAPDSAHTHQGFHFEFTIGPAFGGIEADQGEDANESDINFTGTGLSLGIHAGHSVGKNFVITADGFHKAIYSPRIEANGFNGISTMDYTIQETTIGLGITWYKMPADWYAGATIGIGGFSFHNNTQDEKPETSGGFSWQVRAGKHWWMSDKWGITLGATYGETMGTVGFDGGPAIETGTYDLSSSRFSIVVGVGLR